MQAPGDYPMEQVRRVRLRGRLDATIRPIKPSDAAGLVDLFNHLSRESIYYRFFFKRQDLSIEEASRLATVDYRRRMAFVAETEIEGEPRLIGVVRYEPLDGPSAAAEMAIVVVDAYQHHGAGRRLLHALGDYALTQGISSFLAEVLAENYRMIAFCERAGYPLSIKREGYTLHIWMSLRPSETIRAATASGAAHQE